MMEDLLSAARPLFDPATPTSVVLLSLLQWQLDTEGVVVCSLGCSAHILDTTGAAEEETFDPIARHSWYCPFVYSQGGEDKPPSYRALAELLGAPRRGCDLASLRSILTPFTCSVLEEYVV